MAQYLAHTVNAQLFGLGAGTVGWILTMVTIGLAQWRIWVVSDLSIISSGIAWVGIWKVCFYSHTVVTSAYSSLYCQKMGVSDSFIPMEIIAARVLMLVALVLGLLANASTLYGLRNIFFGLGKHRPIRLAFTVGGVLHLLASVSSLAPLGLNMQAVSTNQNISFPESFHMPPAPIQQHVGPAIGIGLSGAILTVASGVIFLCYRFPTRRIHPKGQASGPGEGTHWIEGASSAGRGHSGTSKQFHSGGGGGVDGHSGTSRQFHSGGGGGGDVGSGGYGGGHDNPAFQSEE